MREKIGLAAGPLVFLLMLFAPAPAGMPAAAWKTAAVAVLMAIWWITEPIPIPATALLPLALFPLLGVATIEKTAAPYANPVIFLFLGGFLIAAAIERTGLHRRVALHLISFAGTSPRRLLLGFMIATALISTGVSNTATAALMLPLALSVVAMVDPKREDGEHAGFATALMLGVAYSASIGGLATLIGTPPNALLAGYLSTAHGRTVGFGQWMILGVPLAALALPAAWLLLVRVHRLGREGAAGTADLLEGEIAALGPWSRGERFVVIVTLAAALAWITRPLLESMVPGLSDAGIALGAALLLFLVPTSARTWSPVLGPGDIDAVPWSVLLLFGGGLSLAAAIDGSGLAAAIGRGMDGLAGLPPWVMVVAITTVVIYLTEMTSNTATAATFLPIVGSAAVGMGLDPAVFAVPAALAASCAFMLPVATPPNAIVYGSGRVTVPQMVRAGFWLNIIMIAMISILAIMLGGRATGH